MISIPLSIFFIVYLVLVALLLVFFFITLSHLFATGTFTFVSFVVTFLVIAAMIVVAWITWSLAMTVDWSQSIVLFGGGF